MAEKTGIAWTDATWNPLAGCSRVSEGCRHCYAEALTYRLGQNLTQEKYNGLTRLVGGEPQWTGKVRLWEPALEQPLRWRTPRRIFVNSMSDLFHEAVSDWWIDRIFAVMALAPWHIFQVLTKRPERMLAYFSPGQFRDVKVLDAALHERQAQDIRADFWDHPRWPLPNVWLIVSVEDQPTADARISLLLQTPAAVRGVSYEPALGPVDFEPRLRMRHSKIFNPNWPSMAPRLDWLVVGGESGPGARPFDLAWARQTIAQCRAAGVPCFVKQLGAAPVDGGLRDVLCHGKRHYTRPKHDPFLADCEARILDGRAPGYSVDVHRLRLRHPKGADPAEWPADLRVREYPGDGAR